MRKKRYNSYIEVEKEFYIGKDEETLLMCLFKHFGYVLIDSDGAVLSNTKGNNVLAFVTPIHLAEKTRIRHKHKGEKCSKRLYEQEKKGV